MDIFNLFGCVGEILEVVIPPWRNKFGKRFGFARFKEVKDERMLAVKLDNIQIDGRKIHANQPRFNRNEGKEVPVKTQNRDGGRREPTQVRESAQRKWRKELFQNSLMKDNGGGNNGLNRSGHGIRWMLTVNGWFE
ncbi:uncharacterized protein LOC131659072 [Vicia villosa]|uniref:uncharacterized protein LOC131659072 n=1 Tax=Vicia villosa TaxID=3911 RepID=UPI00273AD88F|nr:uncharacterized protein LOC131659072 [Vicia villosa]